ncbi:MAG: hypothetical protein AB1414_21470, partial [bacterium]
MNRVSHSTAKRVIQYWLNQRPPKIEVDYSSIKHIIFDGTFMDRPRCIYVALNAETNTLVDVAYNIREGGKELLLFYKHLAEIGLMPESATTDGNTQQIKYLREVWPELTLQRCIIHVQRQGLSWCRRNPKRIEAKELRDLFLRLTNIQTKQDALRFLKGVNAWERRFGMEIKTSTNRGRVFSDIIRARSMLLKALPNLFHYLDSSKIPRSTNALEGYFSRLKEHYRLHRGLSKLNKQKYFNWYFYLKP